MKRYDVLVTIHYPADFKGKRYLKVGFIIQAENEEVAKEQALVTAKLNQKAYPRKYKGCTFSVEEEDIKEFTF